MKTTTLNEILKNGPCGQSPGAVTGWQKLLAGLEKTQPDDAPLHYSDILRINGIDDALWADRKSVV